MLHTASFSDLCRRISLAAALATAVAAPAAAWSASPAATGSASPAAMTTTAQQCAAATGCEAKFCRIQSELSQAQAAGNKRRAEGLREALAQARATCTPASLQADYSRDVAEKASKVAEREAELREAKADGKARKIEKAERKLQDAIRERDEARAAKP